MKPVVVNRRGRALASLTATLGLALAGTAIGTGPAGSAAPAGDCATPAPVSGVAQGDLVHGLTVSSGTTPEPFSGTVLGVLDDGIAPDVDMLMVRLSSDEINRVGGIWQGMSGSPVYDADGDLLGAVAYGLSWGPSPVAGVTPFEDMDDYLAAAPAAKRVAVDSATARMIARSTDVTRAQAADGFSQLPMPMGVSGVSDRHLAKAEKRVTKHEWLPRSTYRMGRAAAVGAPTAAGPDTVVAGGNLAASLSYGDVTQAGVGTATSVCDGRVVGFGHPMAFLGTTSMSLHPADAIYVQEDSLGAPFKVANLGAPAGTISDDHLTGITGALGSLPATSDVSSSVSYHARSRDGASHVTVPQAMASTVFYQLVANHDRVVDGIIPGSELLSWQITGHDRDGSAFDLSVTDRFVSNYDITFDSAFELADFVYSLSTLPGVTIDDVTMDSEVVDDNSTWQVARLEQKVGGSWVKVGKGSPVVAEAGSTPRLRAVLKSDSDTRTVPVQVKLPAKAAGSQGRLQVIGGNDVWSRHAYPRSVAEAEKYADTLVRNDQVQVELFIFSEKRGTSRSATTDPLDKVVTGESHVKVIVR
ncbi:hypothetical protein ACT8ZV_11665 [Nocardioides sp. MAHUQ-72]|uniref:hypothetical protein n=1 Tax=unclassified Nocardioides TaxID=2615069 RepID=UPI00361A90EA